MAYLHPNGNLAIFGNLSIGTSYKQNQTLNLKVVDVHTGSLLGEINQPIKLGALVLGVTCDPLGKVLTIKTNEANIIWSVMNSKVIQSVPPNAIVGYPNGIESVFVGNCCLVKEINVNTGNVSASYNIGSQAQTKTMLSTLNDDLLAVETEKGEALFFHYGKERPVKKIRSNQLFYSPSKNVLTTIVASVEAGSCYQYYLPKFERKTKLNLSIVLRDYLKGLNERARQQGSRKYELLGAVDIDNIRVTDDANTIFVPCVSNRNHWMYIIDANKEQVLFRFQTDRTVELTEANDKKNVFEGKKEVYTLLKKTGGWKTSVSEKSNAPNYGFENKENSALFFGIGKNKTQQQVSSCKALLADKPNELALIYNGKKLGKVDLNQTTLKATWFGLSAVNRSENLVADGTGISSGRISGMKHISEAKADDSLKVVFKTVEGGNRTGVEVLLQDRHGNVYFGASEPEWKHIWCKLMVKQPDGSIDNKATFEVTEYFPDASKPMVMAVGADFSGSMGKQRARLLNKGMQTLAQTKRAADYMSVVKYDHRVVPSDLTRSKEALFGAISQVPFEMLGGGTALLDAINVSIQQIKFLPNVAQRVVIILTDGKDTASRIPLSKLIANAKSNHVKIYAIAYGDEVDEAFLKNLAHRTQGGFYRVANAKDFEWIFQDIYKRSSMYYNIGFKTEQKGVQVHQLKICPPKGQPDSLEVNFDNRLEASNPKQVAVNPIKNINQPPVLKGKASKNIDVVVNKAVVVKSPEIVDDEKTKAEDQFANISLPLFNFYFDKTEIVKSTESRIAQVISFLKTYPDAALMVIGHTDNYGSDTYNQALSEKRAKQVAELIKSYGGDMSRINTIGYGETSPVANNETEQGRKLNRRVEFRITWN